MPERYTPEDRIKVLKLITEAARNDRSLVGCVLVGSGAIGFADEYSDIDILLVVDDAVKFEVVSERWKIWLYEELPVLAYGVAPRADQITLHNFYLSNYLEINCCVLPLSRLTAYNPRYKVIWERTGEVQACLDNSWKQLRESSPLEKYFALRTAGIWNYVNHCYVGIRRGRYWAALHDIEEIRSQIVHLRGYRIGMEPKRFRDLHEFDEAFKNGLKDLLIGSLGRDELLAALEAALEMFFRECREICVELDRPYNLGELEQALNQLIAID